MQPHQQTEDWAVQTLRNVETPSAPASLIRQLCAPPQRRPSRLWVAPAGIASLGLVLVLVGTMQSTTTLAQVSEAQRKVTQYTEINTRILNGGAQFKVTTYRDGKKWRRDSSEYPQVVCDGTRTLSFWSVPNHHSFVLVDGPTRPPERTIDLSKVLYAPILTAKRTASQWRGQRVEVFEVHASYPGIATGAAGARRMESLEQSVFADSKTHLPLRTEVWRDDHRWGDVWEDRYEAPDPALFSTTLPQGVEAIDIVAERAALPARIGKRGAVLLDRFGSITVLSPVRRVQQRPSRVQFVGPNLEPWTVSDYGVAKIGGTTWDVLSLGMIERNWSESRDSVFVSIDSSLSQKLPLVHVSESRQLLAPCLLRQKS